jgi:hypothetical protein
VDKTPNDHDAVAVLRAALAHLPANTYGADEKTLAPLHEKVCGVVDAMKASGMMPEHVLLAVKGIAYEAHLGVASGALVERMVKWCLDQYFKDG